MTQVAAVERKAPANVEQHPATDTAAMTAMIERLATNPAADMGKLQQLLDMRERMEAKAAEQAFNNSMRAAQEEMRPIAADADNPQTKSKYASYHALDRALRPIYTKHGFSLSFDEGDTEKPEHIRVLCYVSHDGGHTRTYRKDMPADGKGAKGGDVMTKTHAAGAAASYGARYLLKGIFNVAVGADDKDGNTPGQVISDDQLAELRSLIDEVGGDVVRLCQHFKIDALPDLPKAKFVEAVGIINLKRARAAK